MLLLVINKKIKNLSKGEIMPDLKKDGNEQEKFDAITDKVFDCTYLFISEENKLLVKENYDDRHSAMLLCTEDISNESLCSGICKKYRNKQRSSNMII